MARGEADAAAARGSDARDDHAIDALIIVALEDELDAVIAEAGGAAAWRTVRDRDGLRHHRAAIPGAGGAPLELAAAWAGGMGGVAAASRAGALIRDLAPSCLAMCGICAGKRGDVALGDVIVADRVYSFDHGKLVAADNGAAPAFFHDIETYNLERAWRMEASALRRDLGWAAHLLPRRPAQRATQQRWLLHAIHAHERGTGPAPVDHPERAALFRIGSSEAGSASDWAARIRELRERKLLALTGGTLALTDAGRQAVAEDLVMYPEGLPIEPGFQVHVGPIATGNAVIEDPRIFERLKPVGRKTLGVEMEAFAIGHAADALPHRAIIAKAVSDHADGDKDDRFRSFACRASAAWLLGFLQRHLVPRAHDAQAAARDGGAGAGTDRGGDAHSDRGDDGPRSPFPDLPIRDAGARAAAAQDDGPDYDDDDLPDELQRRVQRAIALAHPGARLAWKRAPDGAPSAVRTFLEVRTGGRFPSAFPVAIVDGAVSGALLDGFVDHIVKRYRAEQPHIEPRLIHSEAAAAEIDAAARKRRIRLESLLELQGLLDFRPYVAEQTRALDGDVVYPSKLYVPQRIACRIGMDERTEPDALEVLDTWLGHDGPQLLLVLGDSGTGKTFLTRELALRLGRRDGGIVPVLVELRKLDKARSLDALLGQHFIPERGMQRFDHGAFRYMLEEGRIALIFDGFDELALRVTYEAAAEHLETVLQAAIGKAKVVVTSRTEHFINDQQVLRALGERVTDRGFRMARLLRFDERQIRHFLFNRFESDAIAQRWFDLLGEVKDLLGLSHNPRMLSFIAEIPEADLREAAKGGEITSATLYRVLLERWLGYEVRRDHPPGMEAGLHAAARWKAASELARLMWPRKDRTIAIAEIPPELLDAVEHLASRPLGRDAVAFKLGSGTLLSRDEDGRFSFIHQSIIEWLVARLAADDLITGRDASVLASQEISDLMADFLRALAGADRAIAWARGVLSAKSGDVAAANANRLLRRLRAPTEPSVPTAPLAQVPDDELEVTLTVDMVDQDLRGEDLSRTKHLRGGQLDGVNLAEATLTSADLTGASLTDAWLRRASLDRANLRRTDLRGADLSFARLLGADLTDARLDGATLRYARMVGARVSPEALATADHFGAAIAPPGQAELLGGAGHGWSLAWSPDQALLAVGCVDGAIVLADTATGRLVRRLRGHAQKVIHLAFRPDGAMLASSARDGTVRLWQVESGARLHTLHGDGPIAFAPDGRQLATGSETGAIQLWDTATGDSQRELAGHPAAIHRLAYAPSEHRLVSTSSDGAIRVWDPTHGAALGVLRSSTDRVTPAGVSALAFSAAGDLLAVGCDDGTVQVWSFHTLRLLRTLAGSDLAVAALAFSRDGETLLAANYEASIQVWPMSARRPEHELGWAIDLRTRRSKRFAQELPLAIGLAAGGPATDIALSPDRASFAISSALDGSVKIGGIEPDVPMRIVKRASHPVTSLAVSHSSRLVASRSDDGAVDLWEPIGGSVERSARGGALASGLAIALSPDGAMLAACEGGGDYGIRLTQLRSGGQRALRGHTAAVTCLAFSRDGAFLVSGSRDHTVRIWAPRPQLLIHTLGGLAGRVTAVALSPDSALVAAGGDDEVISVWQLETGAQIHILRLPDRPQVARARRLRLAFSPDGAVLAVGFEHSTPLLYSLDSRTPPRSLIRAASPVECLAFSPNGTLLAIASGATVEIWDPVTSEQLTTLEGHAGTINDIAFSARGCLLSASNDCTIRLWNVEDALSEARPPCAATLAASRHGWIAIARDGRYKVGGEITGELGFGVGLCRFEVGELDDFPEAFAQPPRRIPDDEPLLVAGRDVLW